MCVCGRVRLFETPWAVACQASLSMGFSRQVYWSGLPFPSPGDLPHPETKPASPAVPALQVGSLPLRHPGSPYNFTVVYLYTLFYSWKMRMGL